MTNEEYYELIRPYEDVSRIVMTKLDILNHSIYHKDIGKPIHHTQNRIKSHKSIEGKVRRVGLSDSVMDAKDHLTDIAGIRVICHFPEEIYDLVKCLKRQSDLIVIKEKANISLADVISFFTIKKTHKPNHTKSNIKKMINVIMI